jgi:hypothetical protein
MQRTDDPFMRGELVTLREYVTTDEPIGRVVSVSSAGARAEVAWHRRPGRDHEVTVEPTSLLRRVHESEMDPED